MTPNDADDDAYDIHKSFGDAAPDDIEYMFAQTSGGISIGDGRITLKNVSPATLFFSDRPPLSYSLQACDLSCPASAQRLPAGVGCGGPG